MRTGQEYLDSLKDGRKVWVLGEGPIEDLTTHPLTRGMARTYAYWYERHDDPDWRDTLLTEDGRPVAFVAPKTAEDLRRLGRQLAATSLLSGGNVTHTPAYGYLLGLGLLETLKSVEISRAEIEACEAYVAEIARTGRFLTFATGGAPLGFRLREKEADRAAIRVVREEEGGVVISGKLAMHTSSPFADDIFVSGSTRLRPDSEHYSWFIIPVSAPGVRIVARRPAARHPEAFTAPLSHRYDELDAQIWLDEVFVPFERVFTAISPIGTGRGVNPALSTLLAWLFWHQLYGWLAKLEFTLGLALAAADVMGYRTNPAAADKLLDMVIDVQTARSCILAAECDPVMSETGLAMPGRIHIAAGSLHVLAARQRMTEALRRLPGSSAVISPSLSDFDELSMAEGLEEVFGGGGYSARQRAALLNLIWDNVSSGLDGRESAFEMSGSGGVGAWRVRMAVLFQDSNHLANTVLEALEVEMPPVDVADVTVPKPAPTPVTAPKNDPIAQFRQSGAWTLPDSNGRKTKKRSS